MKSSHKWFTLIELLVSSIIIITISAFSISILFDRQSSQLLKEELDKINQDIIHSKKKLWNEITDFEFIFYVWSDFYLKDENKLYKDDLLIISWWINTYSNFASWFTINLVSLRQNNPFLLKIFKDDKIYSKHFLSSTWSLNFNVDDSWNYLFKAIFSENSSNILQIIWFSNFDKKNNIKLNKILDDTNNSYSWIILEQNLSMDYIQYKTLTWNIIETNKIVFQFIANNKLFDLEITK